MVSLLVHNVPVQCETQELALFSPPSGQICDQYAGPYIQKAGGYVQTQPNGMCGICQFANGDQFVSLPCPLIAKTCFFAENSNSSRPSLSIFVVRWNCTNSPQAASFNVYNKFVWRDYGIFWGFIIFQFAAVFVFSYIYLQGGQNILNVLRGQKRKEKKLRQEKQDGVDTS
jgi:ATP-binding cassette subfamily G (WHITE) protein 2 (SNQ2)